MLRSRSASSAMAARSPGDGSCSSSSTVPSASSARARSSRRSAICSGSRTSRGFTRLNATRPPAHARLRAVTVYVHAEIHGLVGRAAELRALLRDHADATSRAPGCQGSAASEPLRAEPGELVLDTWWDDEAALRAHYATEEYGRYASAVGELLARPSDVRIHYVERSVRARGDASLDPTRQG